MITNTEDLAAFCEVCAEHPYVTLDTEFLRERTYYSQLCLLQIAHPGGGEGSAVLVDPLSKDLSLEPLYTLFRNPDVTKVFHAARQDLEIFYVDNQIFPAPFFDTQVAAMVCGFGDQVGYETRIANANLDKSSRFTDWSRRPLSKKQQDYALADVTHLRDIYEHLSQELVRTGRRDWVEEELSSLIDENTYKVDPDNVWRRVKTRNSSPRFLGIVRELAKFREVRAQSKNVPRNRVMKDDALVEVASLRPTSVEDLGQTRLLLRDARRGEIAEAIIAAIRRGVDCPKEDLPSVPQPIQRRTGSDGLNELLRVLLKARAESTNVAPKLIATSAELDRLASEENPDIPTLRGWRYKLFGEDAMKLKSGSVALTAGSDGVRIIPVPAESAG